MIPRLTQTEFGAGSLIALADAFETMEIADVCVIGSARAWAAVAPMLKAHRYSRRCRFTAFKDFASPLPLSDLERGVDALRASRAEAVLGVGGGTALDLAKAAAILAEQEAAPGDIVRGVHTIEQPRRRPLALVPTTSGTGAEVTQFAVVYADGKKVSLDHPYLSADLAIVDPELTADMSPALTATTGADVLAQAIESYWSVRSTDGSRRDAARAITLATVHYLAACDHPTKASRAAMSEAALLAGRAINVTRTTAPHAASYPLTFRHAVPHGHACALTLPRFLLFNGEATSDDTADPRGEAFVHARIDELLTLLDAHDLAQGAAHLTSLFESAGLAMRISDAVALPVAAVRDVLAGVDPRRLGNNPRQVQARDLHAILTSLC